MFYLDFCSVIVVIYGLFLALDQSIYFLSINCSGNSWTLSSFRCPACLMPRIDVTNALRVSHHE